MTRIVPDWKGYRLRNNQVNLISAINARGFMRYMAVEDNVTSSIFIDFLKRIIDKASGPIFLIVDNHSVHKFKEVKEFVKETEGKLRLFHLPPYYPELNPNKHVWNYLKNHKICRETTKSGLSYRSGWKALCVRSKSYRKRSNPTFVILGRSRCNVGKLTTGLITNSRDAWLTIGGWQETDHSRD